MQINISRNTKKIITIAILSFTYGILVGKYHLFPHNLLKYIQDNSENMLIHLRQDISKEGRQVFKEIPDEYKQTDLAALISIKSKEDIYKKRKELTEFILGRSDLFNLSLPMQIENNVLDKRYADIDNLESIDKITLSMDYGINSIAYFFHPKRSNNRLIIYCEGHEGDFILGKNTIKFFLNKGFWILAFDMPLMGMNNQPVVFLDRLGKFKLQIHDHLKFLARPIRFFLEPIIATLNYVTKNYNFCDISMVGISGGGWTINLIAAIEPRVSKSFPVSASYPIFLRSDSPRDYGDFEQTFPELYRIANYLELYIMGSYGKGRKQVQITNKYDPCCFAGIKYRTYGLIVSEIVTQLGEGEFKEILDDTHREHKISDYALKTILKELEF